MNRFVETLEGRRLLSVAVATVSGSTLSIRGDTDVANVIVVSAADAAANGLVTVTLNGQTSTFDGAVIRRLTIVGGSKVTNDISTSLAVSTTVVGGRLADVIRVRDTAASVRAGDGNDSVTAVATPEAPTSSRNPGVSFSGGSGNDTLIGGTRDDVIKGEAGNDVIDVGSGDNTADGGAGNDTVAAGAGESRIMLGRGNDTFNGVGGSHRVFGGAGNDVITVATQPGAGESFVKGGSGNDSIVGGDGVDQLFGNSGRDTVRGMGGDDTVDGGGGNDIVDGGSGSNSLRGLAGRDNLTASPGSTAERNRYYIIPGAKIEPAARSKIDLVERRKRPSGEGFDVGGVFNPFPF